MRTVLDDVARARDSAPELPVPSAKPAFSFRAFALLLLLLTGLCSLLFLIEAIRFLPVRGDNLYPEAAGVLSAQRWAEGSPLYEDYRQSPYLITPFPPAWYAVVAGAAKLGVADLDGLTLFGRLLTLASLISMLAVAYRWNRRIGLSPRLAILTPAFYLSLPILLPWAVTARPDFPATLCVFCALYIVGTRQGGTAVVGAATLSAVAFLMRHNAVAVPVAAVLWLAFEKRWKSAALFCASWGAVVGATFVGFQRYSHGLLGLSLSGATFGTFSLSYIRDLVGRLLTTAGHGYAIALLGFAAFGLYESIRQNNRRTRLLTIYCVVSLGFAFLGTAARGAAVNHFFEPALAMSMLIPTGLASLERSWTRDSAAPTLVGILVLALLLPSLDMQRSYATHNRPEDVTSLLPLVTGRTVFTDVPYLSARSSTRHLVEPVSLMNTESAGGRAAWRSDAVAKDLSEQKYEVVILSTPANAMSNPSALYPRYLHLSPAVQSAVEHNYALCFKLEAGSLEGDSETRYVYAPTSGDTSPPSGCQALKALARAAQ